MPVKTVAEFLGYGVGDLITLSDLQTQEEFKKMSVNFPIREVRKYTEPNGVFTYVGYTVESPTKQMLLILVKTMGKLFEVYSFYKDTAAPLYQAGAGQEACPLYALLTDDLKDLTPRFDAQVPDDKGTHPVTWDRQTVTHGIDFEDSEDVKGICSLGEYFTNDENGGNNFCIIDWKGDAAKGFLEIWYGSLLQNHEIEMSHV
jgi:hypothetical protein